MIEIEDYQIREIDELREEFFVDTGFQSYDSDLAYARFLFDKAEGRWRLLQDTITYLEDQLTR